MAHHHLLLLLLVIGTESKIDIEKAIPLPYSIKGMNLPQPHGSRIINGTEAIPGQFPYEAALFVQRDNNTYFCGGSLLSTRYVLTAAHCVHQMEEFQVILGAHNVSDSSESGRQTFHLTSSDAIEHPGYNSAVFQNDTALLRLPEEAVLTDHVQAIRLPSWSQANNNITFEGVDATISGWGLVADENPYISDVLNYATVPVIGDGLCFFEYLLSALYILMPSQLCTGGQPSNSCSGDSGSPLTVLEEDGMPTQVGVVSLGMGQCEAGRPFINSRLTAFLDFIEGSTGLAIRP